jgi:outer membrane protein TolC
VITERRIVRLGITLIGAATGNAFGQERLLNIYERALQNDPQIREAEANYQATVQTSPQARSQLLPSLQFNTATSARRTFTDSAGYNWSLNLSVPLYTGGLNRARIQQSVYQHRAASEALERVARQTEREARDAYLGVMSDISRVSALRQAVQSNRTALRAVEAGFEVGTRTTVDVLVSQNALSQAETNYARSRYDYILNVLRLKQAAGSLNIEDIEEVDGWLR